MHKLHNKDKETVRNERLNKKTSKATKKHSGSLFFPKIRITHPSSTTKWTKWDILLQIVHLF